MKTTKQLTKKISHLEGKLKWMTQSRKYWKKCAMLQGKDIKRLMQGKTTPEYEVDMIMPRLTRSRARQEKPKTKATK